MKLPATDTSPVFFATGSVNVSDAAGSALNEVTGFPNNFKTVCLVSSPQDGNLVYTYNGITCLLPMKADVDNFVSFLTSDLVIESSATPWDSASAQATTVSTLRIKGY